MLTEQQQQQPAQASALANRSFLYRSNAAAAAASVVVKPTGETSESSATSSSTCLISETTTIVYATLDSLALRSTTLQLSARQQQQLKEPDTESRSSELASQTANNLQPEAAVAGSLTHEGTELRHLPGYTFPGDKKKVVPSAAAKKKSKDGFAFARNVLHYVPVQSRRYYRKSRNLATKSLSSLSSQQAAADTRARKCKSLSRDELKYIDISAPSNFVHLDSGSRYLESDGTEREVRAKSQYAEIALDSSIFLLNRSFVWQQLEKLKQDQLQVQTQIEECDLYDDVGPPVTQQETPECKAAEVMASAELVEELQEEQEVYDDVGPPLISQQQQQDEEEQEQQYEADEEDQVYDDVGPLRSPEVATDSQETYEIPQPSVIEESDNVDTCQIDKDDNDVEKEEEEDVYDDVGPAVVRDNGELLQQSQDSHERVNSLYAGSLQLPYDSPHASDKLDSEWEDLDEPVDSDRAASPPRKTTTADSPKKKNGPRWSCKIRRQRSKASRKSSARSTSRNSRNSSHPAVARGSLPEHVAVSLGTGSVLLLGSLGSQDEQSVQQDETAQSWNHDDIDSKGLLQLRVVLDDEESHQVHETSLYVAEDSSDDSNYETLQTYEPDDFSSSSDDEDDANNKDTESTTSLPQQPPPPSRPIPPPPREESLGHSLGRRMKMLRRTWSITKGSLGRMRRRASGEMSGDDSSSTYDPRKYFSFKRPFGKSQQGGGASSTFYLDKSLSSEGGSEKESACSSGNENEPIYGNAHWYKQVGLYDEQMQRSETSMDHYSVLAEEPLYQFYAANATRVAFESDSDGYEEVEELTPSSVTTDLARPGHRTLWCQTPQVISSGLLQRLTMEERKIQEAKFEIVTSEASYLNSLRVLENEFASNYELAQEVLTGHEREKLFGGVPDVLVASERFLAELEGIWREDPMLPRLAELLLRHADKCAHVYVDYCSNQVDIDATLKELKAKKGYKYLEAVSRIESQPACHSLSLHSFLMLPMQRITRLPLLADAVLSKLSVEHAERLTWERVLAELSQVVARCNEAARVAERRNEMDALARKLEYPAKVPPVELHDRELIRSGTVVQLSSKADTEYKLTFGKKFHKTPLMLMLLTDYLLVTKLKSNSNEETYSVMETCKRSLVALESAPEDGGGPLAGRHAMLLTLLENQAGRQVELVLSCDSDTERERWLDAVSPPKPSCLGETLYESWDCPQVMAVYSYSARQPDEIALQPGDVINVLRKMNDGWLFGEKLLDGEQGWFPGNFTKEVASEHVRARNLRQRHRFLALSGSVLQRKAKQSLSLL